MVPPTIVATTVATTARTDPHGNAAILKDSSWKHKLNAMDTYYIGTVIQSCGWWFHNEIWAASV